MVLHPEGVVNMEEDKAISDELKALVQKLWNSSLKLNGMIALVYWYPYEWEQDNISQTYIRN
jgi:hypothetical protein